MFNSIVAEGWIATILTMQYSAKISHTNCHIKCQIKYHKIPFFIVYVILYVHWVNRRHFRWSNCSSLGSAILVTEIFCCRKVLRIHFLWTGIVCVQSKVYSSCILCVARSGESRNLH